MSDTFNVMDMARDAAAESGISVNDLFQRHEPEQQRVEETPPASTLSTTQKQQAGWVPDSSLTKDMEEFNGLPVTYARDEIKEDIPATLRNLDDESAIHDAGVQKDEMGRMYVNIEDAKKRFGITKLQVPPGHMQVAIYDAASNEDPEKAKATLDSIFQDIIDNYPEFILERNGVACNNIVPDNGSAPAPVEANQGSDSTTEPAPAPDNVIPYTPPVQSESSDLKVVVDKSQLPEISWTDEDIEKVRKARTIELNIVESKPIEFSEIDDADQNTVDAVISKYVRKNNDVTAALPSSRYRCTFTGLSYPEVIDLSNSNEMNTIDGERKKWSLCFDHMKNQSIGPWEEYKWYLDEAGNKIKIAINSPAPNGVSEDDIHVYTKFEDFLHKTSFLDLEFMLWKILCATCMDTEIIQIDCHAKLPNGGNCTNNYDWIYAPKELLEMDSINTAVLDEMKRTGEVSGMENIIANYNESMLRKRNTVKLPDSGLITVFGHISGYDYLESVYPAIKELENSDENDPTLASRGLNYTTLTIVKEFLVQKDNGRYARISGTANMIEILQNLSEIDWQVIGELVRMAMEPYQFRYSLRGIVCPKCKNKSKITIESLTQLLFIVARSLSSVQITFRDN